MPTNSQRSGLLRYYLAWFSIATFYLYQYILRVSPGVMVLELRRDFRITAEEFSTLGAFYLYAYSLVQIPLGLTIDRLGIRRTVAGSILFCVVGALASVFAVDLWQLQLSRILVGLGSGAAFMGALKVAIDFLPAGKRGFFMGATLTLGTLGALTAGKPLVALVDTFGWRNASLGLVVLGLVVLGLVWGLVPSAASRPGQERPASCGAGLAREVLAVLKNKRIMVYAFLAIGVYTPLSVLADLWGTAFLMQKFDMGRADAAQSSMMMYVGLALGSLLLPWLCEIYQLLNTAIQVCSFALLAIFAMVLYGPNLSPLYLVSCLILLGFACGSEMMCFTGASQGLAASQSGTTLGVVNTLNMLGGAFLQQAIGLTLDLQWHGRVDENGLRLYSTDNYRVALSILVGVIALCCLLALYLPRLAQKKDRGLHPARS